MKTVIEMARESELDVYATGKHRGTSIERLMLFTALFREDEREKQQNHSGEAADMVQEPFGYFRAMPFGWEDCGENDEGAVALYDRPQVVEQQEPVAWMKNQFITDDAGFNIGTDDPEVHFGKDCPEDSGWWPVYAETISTQKPVVFRYKEYPLDTRSSWHYVTKRKAIPDGFPFQELYTTPPTAAIAARAMRDAAVKVCRDLALLIPLNGRMHAIQIEALLDSASAIAALPVPEVQWRDLTTDEIREVFNKFHDAYGRRLSDGYEDAIIAKFKEKQLPTNSCQNSTELVEKDCGGAQHAQ